MPREVVQVTSLGTLVALKYYEKLLLLGTNRHLIYMRQLAK